MKNKKWIIIAVVVAIAIYYFYSSGSSGNDSISIVKPPSTPPPSTGGDLYDTSGAGKRPVTGVSNGQRGTKDGANAGRSSTYTNTDSAGNKSTEPSLPTPTPRTSRYGNNEVTPPPTPTPTVIRTKR